MALVSGYHRAESKYTVTFINRNEIVNIFQNKCSL